MELPRTFPFPGIFHVAMKDLAVKVAIETKQFRWCRSKTSVCRTTQKYIVERSILVTLSMFGMLTY